MTRSVIGADSAVVAAVAVGGGLGAAARYGAALAWPTGGSDFPWTTLLVNATGCAAIGVLMVVVSDVWVAHRLVRPFLGTGVLGGFTTFSTYAVDVRRLVGDGQLVVAMVYAVATVVGALAMVWAASVVTRRLIVPGRRRQP